VPECSAQNAVASDNGSAQLGSVSELRDRWHGRGAASNPPNRFRRLVLEPDADWNPAQDSAPATQFLLDRSQSIISCNDSPDLGFSASLNPYRGCEHGCAYCFARPTHEHMGFSAGLDFETRIVVKDKAPELLRREMASARWQPQVLALSGVTDPYQPVERRLEITRRVLRILAEFRNPVCLVTKNALVARDRDVLADLAQHRAAAVNLSITTLDSDLARKLEPRATLPVHRLAAIRQLAQAGVPVGVLVAPVIPGLTDHEIPSIIRAAAEAGAGWACTLMVRLPLAVGPLFTAWLEHHAPGLKDKVLGRIRAMRGGELNDARFRKRMRGEGVLAEQIAQLGRVARRRAGLARESPELSIAAFRRPGGKQMEMNLG